MADIDPAWVEVGAQALVAGKSYGGWMHDEDAWRTVVLIAEKVIVAVEPLIRADEREHSDTDCQHLLEAAALAADNIRLTAERDTARAEVEKWRAKWSLAVAEKVAVEAAFAALRERIATQIEEYGGPPQCDCEVCRYCYWSRAIEGAARIARDKGVERNG